MARRIASGTLPTPEAGIIINFARPVPRRAPHDSLRRRVQGGSRSGYRDATSL